MKNKIILAQAKKILTNYLLLNNYEEYLDLYLQDLEDWCENTTIENPYELASLAIWNPYNERFTEESIKEGSELHKISIKCAEEGMSNQELISTGITLLGLKVLIFIITFLTIILGCSYVFLAKTASPYIITIFIIDLIILGGLIYNRYKIQQKLKNTFNKEDK